MGFRFQGPYDGPDPLAPDWGNALASGSDETLIQRARAGDARAFQALCNRYESLLRARARRWIVGAVQRKVSLGDVLQEAYYLAHQRLDEFEDRGEGAFGAWLAQIVEFKAREASRRYTGAAMRDTHREVTSGGGSDTSTVRGHEPSPIESAMTHEATDAVRLALTALSKDHRMVLELVRFDNLPLKEAAVLMERSYDATRKLYGRAVAALARELMGPGVE